jgi:N-acetylglucosaminyldiphosphoundecaprenol N-acetyl-beta-D-mannosaminyltransferase
VDSPPTVTILGVPVHSLTTAGALASVKQFIAEPRLHQIATVNPEFVMAAQDNAAFAEVLQRADLCLPDGVGLIYASRRLGRPLPERIAGSSFVYELAHLAATEGWSIFLLGAGPGVAEDAAAILTERTPGLKIAGTYAGSPDPTDNDDIVARINASEAGILLVAYGAPKQDLWIDRNRDALHTVRVAMGIGGSLDFIAGRAVRAPQWVQDAGLEWLHRLVKEPWRWRRMLALPRFGWRVLVDPTPSGSGKALD